MEATDPDGLLRGCNVIDLSGDAAGAIATWYLAAAGADVVELAGDEIDRRFAQGLRTWNRGKRSARLDIDRAEDRAVLDRLVAGADVVVTSSDRGERAPDVEALLERHPHLVVCDITWYPAGDNWKNAVGDELLLQARVGLMGEVLTTDHRPTFVRFPVSIWGAGLLAAAGIAARLFQRARRGTGGVVRTTHLQGALYFMSNLWTEADHAVAELQTKYGVLNRPHPWIFECGDGRFIQTNVAFVDVPLVIEVLAEMGLEQPELTAENIEEVSKFYTRMFARRPSAVWLDAFHELDIDCERLQHVGELFGDGIVVSNGYAVEVDDPELGAVRQAAVPLDVEPGLVTGPPAPRAGEHTDEIRSNGWRSESRLSGHAPRAPSATADRPPLDGLRVVDLGMNLSAPVCAKLMSDLGASVIKVERCDGGDRLRAVHVQFAGGNRGKRSIGLKLGHPDTRPLVKRLVRDTDVVVHNLREDKARKLGIDYPALSELEPSLVYAQVSGYGFVGPTAGWPARDPSVGCWSGWTLDGSSESRGPIWLRLLIGDTGAAVLSLYGILLILLRRELDGTGGRVRTSLLGTAAMYASESYLDLTDGSYAGVERVTEDVAGTSERRRMYPASDGWVAVLAEGAGVFERFLEAVGANRADDLEAATSVLPSDELVATLARAGVPAEPVRIGYERSFFADPAHVTAGLVAEYAHPQHGGMRQPGQYWQMGERRLWNGLPPPVFGQHTSEILDELDCSPERQAELAAAGLVAGAIVAQDT